MDAVDIISTLVKVGVTFALLFITLRLVGRFYGGNGQLARSGAGSGVVVEVLSRTTVAKGNQVVLTRMGRRVVALGVSTQGVSLLTELDDDDLGDSGLHIEGPAPMEDRDDRSVAPVSGFPAGTPDPEIRSSWRDVMESLRERTVRR